jgi:hypothetical protein
MKIKERHISEKAVMSHAKKRRYEEDQLYRLKIYVFNVL